MKTGIEKSSTRSNIFVKKSRKAGLQNNGRSSRDSLSYLHQTLGNQAVQRLFRKLDVRMESQKIRKKLQTESHRPGVLLKSMFKTKLNNMYQDIVMMKRSTGGDVPQWFQLPGLAKRELSAKGYTEAWFNDKNERQRLTVFNIYVKLRGLNLWSYVARESSSGIGIMEFNTGSIKGLKSELHKRRDFTDPESSLHEWSSREKRSEGSLHFKHFKGWPANKVQAHIDKAGLHGGTVPIIGPLIQAIRHFIDWLEDGYKDVFGIRNILLKQGWWREPLIVKSESRSK